MSTDYPSRAVSLEIAGPIDELLDKLEEQAEAAALDECTVHHPGVGSPRVRRVDVDLGPLAGCGVEFTAAPHVPDDAFDHIARRRPALVRQLDARSRR